jgi:hypothetical protein
VGPGYLISTASYRAYVNAAPDVAIGMAAVISCVPRDQVGGQSRPGGGLSIFSGLELDFEVFPSQGRCRVLGQCTVFR